MSSTDTSPSDKLNIASALALTAAASSMLKSSVNNKLILSTKVVYSVVISGVCALFLLDSLTVAAIPVATIAAETIIETVLFCKLYGCLFVSFIQISPFCLNVVYISTKVLFCQQIERINKQCNTS